MIITEEVRQAAVKIRAEFPFLTDGERGRLTSIIADTVAAVESRSNLPPAVVVETHQENLERVSLRIGWAIRQFFARRLAGKREFHADELKQYVSKLVAPVAPNSTYRIMYDLREHGFINYRLLSRRKSLYEVMPTRA